MKRSPSSGSTDVVSKRISGCLAASRKSGEIRCASRCSLSVRRDSTWIVPASDGCSPPWIRPSNCVKRPLIELKRSLVSVTWKPIVVWTGSTTQAPAGMTSRVMVVLFMSGSFLSSC